MIWVSFAASVPGQLAIVEDKIHSQVYRGILQNDIGVVVHKLKLKTSWVMMMSRGDGSGQQVRKGDGGES